MAKKKETFKQMFDRMMADPNITNSEMFKDSEKYGEAMDSLTAEIVRPCLDYANEHGEEDEGWAYTIMISLARATCKIFYAFQHTSNKKDEDIFKFYYDELLPMCKEIAYRESDHALKEAKKEKKGDIPFETKKDVILAIADPNMAVDDIIDKFFKKDLNENQRKEMAGHIEQMRVEYADKLAKVHEHADENGNYKA
jgi:hypothetical protein